MKTAYKLALAVPCALLLVIELMGQRAVTAQNTSIKTIYEDRVVPLKDLKIIADAYAVSVIDTANKANAGIITAEVSLQEIQKARLLIQDRWSAYKSTYLTPEEKKLADEASDLFKPADESVAALIQYLSDKRGFIPNQLNEFDGPLYKSVDPISNQINKLVELQLRVVADEYKNSNNIKKENTVLNWIISFIALSLSLFT